MNSADLSDARAIAALGLSNPFLPERIELEKRVLGSAFTPLDSVWHARADMADANPNVPRIGDRARTLVDRMRKQIGKGATDADRRVYRELAVYVLYDTFRDQLVELIGGASQHQKGPRATFYDAYLSDLQRLLVEPGVGLPHAQTPERLFACFFQVRRAFHHIFVTIAGGSLPTALLRARVWQSVFTHDLRRYQRVLWDRMGDATTLITGPSGAGKELVARAIGLSRYVPFDARTKRFALTAEDSLFALNLSALSPTLIESELFGHRRGAFTGAVADREGWLEVCPPAGTVFLDEIGEIDASIQVKLLRVLETRTFQPLGSTDDRHFRGKIVAATNRDLAREMHAGRFREDLYYRLCADTVSVPSLHERIADSPTERTTLVRFLAERLVGKDEADSLTDEAVRWIDANLGPDYAWPGNVRELSHCVSNVLIHADYRPATAPRPSAPRELLSAEFLAADLTADELLDRYCTLAYQQTGSYVAAAARLGLDRRTVRRRVDEALLERLR